MTTVAWDGRTLAADKRAVSGATPRTVTKLYVGGRYVYGGTGQFDEVEEIGEWVQTGADPTRRPTCDDSGCAGIVIDLVTGEPHLVEGKRARLTRMHEKFWASGSGRDFALAAMALGKTAKEAVELAARFDVSTGNGVDVIDVPAWVPR